MWLSIGGCLLLVLSCASALPSVFYTVADGDSSLLQCFTDSFNRYSCVPYPGKTFSTVPVIPYPSHTPFIPYGHLTVGNTRKGNCKEGEIFNPSIGICLPVNNCYPYPNCDHLDKDKKKNTDTRVHTPSSGQSNQRRGGCKEGEIFIDEIGICAPENNCYPYPNCDHLDKDKNKDTRVETPSSGQSGHRRDCKEGEIFNPSIGICLPVNNCYPYPNCDHLDKDKKKNTETFLRTSVLPTFPVVPLPISSSPLLQIIYRPKCKEGEILNPSIGICVPANNCYPYPNCDHLDKNKNKDTRVQTPSSGQTSQRRDCKEGEIFNPSIGICLPSNNCYPYPNCDHLDKDKKKDIRVQNPSDDDDDDDDDEASVRRDCKKGEIFNPSIGICIPANNCYPHPNCDHLKENEKKDD